MSSVYRRADGRWCASAVIDGQRRTVYGRTRKEAESNLLALHQQPSANIETVAEFLQRWLDQVVRHHNAPRTYDSYAERIRLDITPHIGHHQLSELTPEHIQTMLTTLLERLSPRTVQYDHSILRRALNQAVEWELLGRNPAQRAKPPRVERHEVTPLTVEQAQALLQAASGHRLEALYRLALSLGLRQSEILSLRWNDIDFERGLLRVRRGKSASASRTLVVPHGLLTALQEHAQRMEIEGLRETHGLVFPTSTGNQIGKRNMITTFKRLLVRAGLPETIRFHDLRHSCASFMIAQGVHHRVIMQVLGHAQFSTTMNIYAHVLDDVQGKATEGIDKMWLALSFDEHEPDSPNNKSQ